MNNVFVCSEFGGKEANLVLARKYCHYVLENEHNPFAPHLFYPQFLNDKSEEEREIGIRLGTDFLLKSKQVWVFVKNGVLSNGMLKEINFAIDWSVPQLYFDATDIDNIIEMRHIPSGSVPTRSQLLSPKPFGKTAVSSFSGVEVALKAGVKYEDLQDQLDSFLGPLDNFEKDEETDLAWEKEYRGGRLEE